METNQNTEGMYYSLTLPLGKGFGDRCVQGI